MLLIEAIEQFRRWRQFKNKPDSSRGYVMDLKILCLCLHNPDIEKIGLDDILNHMRDMQAYGWEHNTFIRKACAFRKFFEFFRLQGLKVLDPLLVPLPDKKYKLPRVATEDQYQEIIKAIPVNDHSRNIRNLCLVKLLWDTGARSGEICSLDTADLDLDNMKAIIRTEKNRGSRPFREIYWTPDTNKYLKRWLDRRKSLKSESPALFISVGPRSGKRLDNGGVSAVLWRASELAGLPTINAHSFRHHMGHDIIKKGGSNADVAAILGHTNLNSSFIYTMFNQEEQHERYRKFKGI